MKTWADYKSEVTIDTGFAVIMTTDSFMADRYPLSEATEAYLDKNLNDKLLDMRIFNETAELRVFRGDVGECLRSRILDDANNDMDTYYDEQYLDIDDKRSVKCFAENEMVRATGGGYYKLPLESFNDVKLIIKNYIDYDNGGQAYIKDWRLCNFVNEEV